MIDYLTNIIGDTLIALGLVTLVVLLELFDPTWRKYLQHDKR